MPIVRVTMAAGRSQEQKSALARDITQALMQQCGADAANVNILFEDVELGHQIISLPGRMMSTLGQKLKFPEKSKESAFGGTADLTRKIRNECLVSREGIKHGAAQ